jgi:hypothetical protein
MIESHVTNAFFLLLFGRCLKNGMLPFFLFPVVPTGGKGKEKVNLDSGKSKIIKGLSVSKASV